MLNQAADFSSGVANLTSLGMTYTGNATTGTFTATSGGKTGTSGSVAIGVGALDHFAFSLASPQTNGTVFTGTNTVTAQDIGNNTITTYSAASNPVTITAVSPLTGTVSGLHGSNVLNAAGDFSSGVANLTSLGMTYSGNAATGTFTATSGGKTGTSGSVVINAGALASFTFSAASPQTDGVAFTGTNTLTAKDGSGNTITGFNAATNNVTITAVSPLTGTVSGLDTPANVLNTSGDFVSGVANLTSLGMTYTGNAGTGTFTATSGGKTGTSGSVVINVGALDHFTFAAAGSETDGLAFTGTNTLTAQDIGGNTITAFNASTNNVTLSANTPLTGTVSGLDTPANVLNQAADFSSGVANLTSLGMTYTGNATTGTFTATSGGKTGTSGSVAIGVGALDHFAFSLASPQTNGTVFTGTNTVTAQDIGNNTITTYSAASNPVTITAVSPLTGTVSGLHGSNVLNAAGDFSSGVANLTSLGMTYSGNAATGTFTATSGGKTGTSGSVVINAGALASFTFGAASPQTDGVAFTGTNTLTAKDGSGNTITGFNAATNNVTITAVSPLTGTVSGLDTPANVLNTSGDFVSGVANLTSLGMTYTGNAGTGTFTATSGGKTGTSGSVVINVGALDHFTFVAAGSETDGLAFTGTNTLTAQDIGGNTITAFNASTNNVTLSANTPLTGTVSGLDTPANVLNQAADFSSGVANLTSLGMTYTGNATTGTFTATSGGKTGTSGSVAIGVGAQSKLALSAASTTPTAGVADNLTVTAQDVGGNTVTSYTGNHNLTFGGASAAPNATSPTVTSRTGTATNFGTATSITFTNGVAQVSSGSNGVMTLYDAQTASISVTDGTLNNSGSLLSVTVAGAAPASLTLVNCVVQGTAKACNGTYHLGKLVDDGGQRSGPGFVGNGATIGTTINMAVSSSSNTNYSITSGTTLTINGTATPPSQSTGTFTVKHNNNSTNTATITVHVTSGPSLSECHLHCAEVAR